MRLIRQLRAALATGELAYLRAEMIRRGFDAEVGAVCGPLALAAPLTDWAARSRPIAG